MTPHSVRNLQKQQYNSPNRVVPGLHVLHASASGSGAQVGPERRACSHVSCFSENCASSLYTDVSSQRRVACTAGAVAPCACSSWQLRAASSAFCDDPNSPTMSFTCTQCEPMTTQLIMHTSAMLNIVTANLVRHEKGRYAALHRLILCRMKRQ